MKLSSVLRALPLMGAVALGGGCQKEEPVPVLHKEVIRSPEKILAELQAEDKRLQDVLHSLSDGLRRRIDQCAVPSEDLMDANQKAWGSLISPYRNELHALCGDFFSANYGNCRDDYLKEQGKLPELINCYRGRNEFRRRVFACVQDESHRKK